MKFEKANSSKILQRLGAFEKGDEYCMIGSRKEWKRIIRLINDIRQSTSDDKLVNWKLMQIYSGQLKLARELANKNLEMQTRG